jgi:hypothetical protein
MIDILLCGDPFDSSIADALIPALSLCGGLCFSDRNAVMECGDSARYFLYESDTVPKIGMKRGILLLKDKLCETMPVQVPDGFVGVIGSRNAQAARMMCGSGASVVTCGTGPKDTLSLAGLDTSAACVSLQRNLVTLDGELLEPHDFSITLLQRRSPEQVLAVSAVLLLSGVDSEQGYRI